MASLLVDGKVTLYPVFAAQQADLVVMIHASASKTVYITDEEIAAVKAGFAAFLTEKGLDALNVEYVIVTGANGDGFAQAVADNGAADVLIGGNNMDTSTPAVTLDSQYGKASVLEGMFENTSRKVGVVAGCANRDNAVLFYSYMTGTPEPDEPASTVPRVGIFTRIPTRLPMRSLPPSRLHLRRRTRESRSNGRNINTARRASQSTT